MTWYEEIFNEFYRVKVFDHMPVTLYKFGQCYNFKCYIPICNN